MKKLMILCVILALILSFNTQVIAQDAIETTASMVTAISIDPYNRKNVEESINLYNMMPEVARDLRKYSEKCISGEIEGDIVYYYVPTGRSTRTYKGYGNRTYYEEYIQYSESTSGEGEVRSGTVTEYELQRIITGYLESMFADVADTYSFGSYSLARLLLNPRIGRAYQLGARLKETKTKRYTYIYEGDELHFGSLTERVVFYFNFYNYGDFTYASNRVTKTAPHFSSGYDRIAYSAYPSGGENEVFVQYEMGGAIYSSLN